jgi:tetratricopeptide (TPR) repeat protein
MAKLKIILMNIKYLKQIILIFTVSVSFYGCFWLKPVIAGSIDNQENLFNLRVTREEFAEIYDTLVIQDENNPLGIADVLFSVFNTDSGRLKRDEIFSSLNNKFKPDAYKISKKKKSDENTEISGLMDNSSNYKPIYNINSGNSFSKGKADSDMPGIYSFLEAKQTPAQKFNDNLAKANDYINSKDFDSATKILASIEKISNISPVNLSNIAKLYSKTGNYNKAVELLEKAVLKSPQDSQIIYTYAVCLYKNNELELAEKNFLKTIKLKPDFMFAYYNLGNLYYKKNDFHRAVDFFNKALEYNSDNPDIIFNIGLTLEMLDNKDLAKEFYSKCLELKPSDKQAQKALERLNN